MAKSVISYDKDLPEIPGRRPWEKPTQHLVKDQNAPTGWAVADGRRPSKLLLVPKIREQVDEWRESGYPRASDVTRRLFEYWFEEDHEVPGFGVPFRYYFCQREAIETLAWLVEIAGQRDAQERDAQERDAQERDAQKLDAQKLIQAYAPIFDKDLFTKNITFQTTTDGQRQIRRYVPELDAEGVQELDAESVQDLPPENLRRFAFKMATGSGKTWVMAMAVVWSYFHKKKVRDSDLSTNFLIVAPNVIVYQRLEKDFAANRIFYELPLIPPEWRGAFSQKVILRGEATEPDPSGNLFLTNVQQLYESRDEERTPANAIEALLGRKPAKDLAASGQRSMLERVKSLEDLVVMNDEAHHVHDNNLAWSQSLLAIHCALPKGLALWLDFSATPKDQNGMYFPWTVCDYPLAQAVEDRIVKAPLIVTKEDDPTQPKNDPDGVTANNIGEKYGYWLRAAVQRWKEHHKVYEQLGTRPVLFIMAEKNAYADAIGEYLWKTKEFGFEESEVLVIHTDAAGEITKDDLEKAREAARDIDKAESEIKAIVSVMMLREGWDVRNVTVVLGLRPFTAKAEILPEQVIGRGLRLMTQVSPDRTQTLEVLGTCNLLNVLRSQLEAEGVGVASTKTDPPPPFIIAPLQERLEKYDIAIPLTKPSLVHDIRKLSELKVGELQAIYDYDQEELAEPFRMKLNLEFATTETEVHQADIAAGELPPAQELLASITNKVIDRAKLPNRFAELYPAVRDYVATRCFGKSVNLDTDALRSHLSRLELQEGIAEYLARKIAELTVERRAVEFDKADFKLSETKPFSWRRNLPPLEAKKTVFNYVATYNDFERSFAKFLDKANDVDRFASLGTTEQGESGTQFRVDYLKPSGAIGFYHPDWVVVQKTEAGEVNWIIETKGRVWEGTATKDEALKTWCKRISAATGAVWRYARINQAEFDRSAAQTLGELVSAS
jgi:type III restriction enzyme